MKRILFIVLVVMGCSDEDKTVFRIEDNTTPIMGDGYLSLKFSEFEQKAIEWGITVPKDNMILRWFPTETPNNDSKSFMKGNQLYIEIDPYFINGIGGSQNYRDVLFFQQFANALLDTPWRDCGMMWKIETDVDVYNRDYSELNYNTLFDPSEPC